ncbi:hypothetical protein GCM10010515_29160 [Streptomyces fructofermentans]|uniref:Uncharacterized protein n=1 Tax=Streptomyces fructofermentans TaxID=152141 RepID=A0A918KDE5_9ACTN|nr:hypothetical protein GCM10010515_29160 [Streptomyces fructofermentans]
MGPVRAVGIVAALIGSAPANAFDVADTDGVDRVEWLIRIGLAALGVAALDGSRPGRRRPLGFGAVVERGLHAPLCRGARARTGEIPLRRSARAVSFCAIHLEPGP